MPSEMAFAGRPSALAEPFVPSGVRRAVQRPSGVGSGLPHAHTHGHGHGHTHSHSHSHAHAQLPHRGRGVIGMRGSGPGAGGGISRTGAYGETYGSGELRTHAREEANLLARTSNGVPDFVGGYGALYPMDGQVAHALLPPQGAHVQQYKAISHDGEASVLLRVVGVPPAGSSQIVRASETWRRVRHSGIAKLREVFTDTAFSPNTNEVIVSYQFPGRARTFTQCFLSSMNNQHQHNQHQYARSSPYGSSVPSPLPEDALWALASQFLSQVAECHKHGLTLRGALDPEAVLVVGRNRVRLFGVGLNDMLDPAGADHVGVNASERGRMFVKQDLTQLSTLLLLLSLRNNVQAVRQGTLMFGIAQSLDTLRLASYSQQWVSTIEALVNVASPTSTRTISDVLQTAAPRITQELGNVWGHADSVTKLLFDEFESSRMLRLSSLISFVTERDDPGGGATWSETGDRYVVKLFRDYLFHRQDDNGRAILDMGGVVDALHRLDIGSQEQVLLSARDEKSLIVATYEEIRRCLTQAVDELIMSGHKSNLVNSVRGSRALQRF